MTDTTEKDGPIFVTWNDDTNCTHWLECFADNPAADGKVITGIDPGTGWRELAARVAEHQAEHGCAGRITP